MKNTIILMLFVLTAFFSSLSASAFHMEDKMYIDAESFNANVEGDGFYVHIGHNVWIMTCTINRDAVGLFTYDTCLKKTAGPKADYERRWKCPYCYQYWPIGKPCGNKDCPSKY